MNSAIIRLSLLGALGLVLTACADHPAQKTTPHTATVVTSSGSATGATRTTKPTTAAPSPTRSATPKATEHLPDTTGIGVCDDYLASYKSCHIAAGIYTPEALDSRYQLMRTTLLRDSQDPDMRAQLTNRCTSLATQLKEALHGKPCTEAPAPVSSTATN
jgi:hypothetical protein